MLITDGANSQITAKDTTPIGGLIANATKNEDSTLTDHGKLNLTTETLTVSDLQDRSKSDQRSTGMQVSTGLTTDEKGKSNFSENGTTTVNLSHSGHNREGETQATLGLGNVTVGGKKVEETNPELNRDVNQAQITTLDQQTGALNASVTVDNKVIIDAAKATVQGVTTLVREIKAMGDDLSPELRSRLGATGELVVDTLIRQGVPDEVIAQLLVSNGLVTGLEGIEQGSTGLQEQPFDINAALAAQVPPETDHVPGINASFSAESSAGSASPQDGSVPTLATVTVSASSLTGDEESSNPNPLAVGLAGAGKVQQVIDQLRETNEEAASALALAVGIATGGFIKPAAKAAADYFAGETGYSEKVAEVQEKVVDAAGGLVMGIGKSEFTYLREDEKTFSGLMEGEKLGSSAQDISDGFDLLLGLGLPKSKTGSGSSGTSAVHNGHGTSGSQNAPDFVVSPNGTAFPVPKGAQGPIPVINPAGNQTGTAYTGGSGGANSQVDTIRIMNPSPARGNSPAYPDGYIKYENKNGQGVDPYTGRTLPNTQSHFPIQ